MDLALDDDGDLTEDLSAIDGSDAVRQALQVRFQLFRGEWFLDRFAGVPYYQQILRKQPKGLAPVDAILKDTILATPGVRALVAYASELSAARHLTVRFTVTTDFGPLEETWQASL